MMSLRTHYLIVLFCAFLNVVLTTKTHRKFKNVKEDLNHFSKNVSSFNTCLLQIMSNNMPCKAFTSIVYSTTDISDIIETVSKDDCYSIIVRNFESNKWIVGNEFYVIISEDHTKLLAGLHEMKRDSLWNPRAKFIIAIKHIDDKQMEQIFEEFIKLKMYSILFLNHTTDGNTLIYTYYPFRHDNCGDNIDDIVLLGNCFKSDFSIEFPKNNISESHNCKIKAVRFAEKPRIKVPGRPDGVFPIVEQYVLDNYVQHSNFTIEYKVIESEKDFGIVHANGTVTGLLLYINNNIGDIAIGSTVIIKNRASLFDYIYGFNYASFKLYTSSLGSEMWKTVYMEFDLNTYFIILLFYCLTMVVCIAFLKTTPQISHSRIYIMVKLCGFLYLGNGTEPYARTKRLRVITLCWIWFTFFISSFYNSDMYSLITGHTQRVRQIEPNKINSIPYKPCIPKVIHTFFIYAYNERLPQNYDDVICHSIDGALFTTANGNDLFTVQMKPSYTEREMELVDEDGNHKLDSWDFGSDILLGFYINKGFPFKKNLQRHAQYMYQTGLVDNYIQNMLPPKSAIPRRKQGVAKTFVLEDFRVHFAVLLVGSALSTFIFMIEMLYKRKIN